MYNYEITNWNETCPECSIYHIYVCMYFKYPKILPIHFDITNLAVVHITN